MFNWEKDDFEITLNVMSTVQSVLFELPFFYIRKKLTIII